MEGCAKATASSSLLALREAKGASEGAQGSYGELWGSREEIDFTKKIMAISAFKMLICHFHLFSSPVQDWWYDGIIGFHHHFKYHRGSDAM